MFNRRPPYPYPTIYNHEWTNSRVQQYIQSTKGFTWRPIVIQLDLQSVEKVPFGRFTLAFAPNMLEIGLPRLRMTWSFLQDLSRAVARFSTSRVAGNHRQHLFDPTGSDVITISNRVDRKKNNFSIRFWDCNQSYSTQLDRKSADDDFLQLGPWRSWKQLWIDLVLEKSPIHSEARKTNFRHFLREKSSCERTERHFFNGLQIQQSVEN